jgi:His/Glu/Gln/Arg/opine family amino acid ABC transporter permease subunit
MIELFDGKWIQVWNVRWSLLSGLTTVSLVAILALIASALFGTILAVLRGSKSHIVSFTAFLIIQFCRGVPLYVLLLWLFYGLAASTNIRLDPLTTGVASLAILNSGYFAELMRAALNAVPEGQSDATMALGMSRWDWFRYVQFPQAIQIGLPAAGNVFVDIIKGTAVLSVITVNEVLKESQRWADYYSAEFEFYTAAAIIYAVVVIAVTVFWRRLEWMSQRHLRR